MLIVLIVLIISEVLTNHFCPVFFFALNKNMHAAWSFKPQSILVANLQHSTSQIRDFMSEPFVTVCRHRGMQKQRVFKVSATAFCFEPLFPQMVRRERFRGPHSCSNLTSRSWKGVSTSEKPSFEDGGTCLIHFPSLLQIAVPGPFLFCGEVPEELKQAAIGMGLDATFAPRVFGFNRN